MKTLRYLFIIIILFSITGCATWKQSLSSVGNIDAVINNSITDFIRTSKLYNADTVFHINIQDVEDIFIVSISGDVDKIHPQISDTVGGKTDVFPTNYIIKGGRLFYWNDPKQVITKEILEVLSKFKGSSCHKR